LADPISGLPLVNQTQGADMLTLTPPDTIGIGPNDASRMSLPRELAESLLRACSLPAADDRTYTSVQILPTPSGQNLYVRSSFYG
jgi:hypothetical protein